MADILIHHNLAGVIEYVGSHSQKISPIKNFCNKFFTDLLQYNVV
jgi:hypothetical protein